VIRITGDPALTGGIPATLSGMTGKRVLFISGNSTTKIQLDHIAVTGGAVGEAAGIYLAGSAELILETGGVIEGNISTGNGARGAGVLTLGTSKFTMKDGSIRNNRNQRGFGGGIYIGNNSVFTMEGGDITENYSYAHGGGVHLTGAGSVPKFFMTGGVITNNRTLQTGGGVAMANGETRLFDGIRIYANVASNQNDQIQNGQELAIQPSYGGRLYYNDPGAAVNTVGSAFYEDNPLGPILP
jgi:hypothetical protein